MSKLSMDLKVMPRSQKGHKFILCIIDEMMNYLITVPIFQSRSDEGGEALIEHFVLLIVLLWTKIVHLCQT